MKTYNSSNVSKCGILVCWMSIPGSIARNRKARGGKIIIIKSYRDKLGVLWNMNSPANKLIMYNCCLHFNSNIYVQLSSKNHTMARLRKGWNKGRGESRLSPSMSDCSCLSQLMLILQISIDFECATLYVSVWWMTSCMWALLDQQKQ